MGEVTDRWRLCPIGQLVHFLMEAVGSVRFVGLMIRCFVRAIGLVLFGGISAVAEDLDVVKWSGDLNVPDPVALTVDPQGRVYVTDVADIAGALRMIRAVGDLVDRAPAADELAALLDAVDQNLIKNMAELFRKEGQQ